MSIRGNNERSIFFEDFDAEVSETLGFETGTETWVVSVPVSGLETRPLKAESQSQCLRPQIKSLRISVTV